MDAVSQFRGRTENYVRQLLVPVVAFAQYRGITANQVTITGCLLTVVSAGALIAGYPITAGVVFLVASTLDMVDGALARAYTPTRAGALLDSALDRVGEGAMFSAIAMHFLLYQDGWGVAATLMAWLGASVTSYVRARTQSLGADCPGGLIKRAERVVLLAIGMLFDVLFPVMVVLALTGIGTSMYRIVSAFYQLSIPEPGGARAEPRPRVATDAGQNDA